MPGDKKAAKTLDANWKQRFRRVTLLLLAPGLATTFILIIALRFINPTQLVAQVKESRDA